MRNVLSFVEYLLRLTLVVLIVAGSGCSDNRDNEDGEEAIPEVPPSPLEAEIRLPSQGEHGLFDPSMDQVPGTGRLYLSYSSVASSVQWPTFNPHSVHTRLAYTDDGGKTWSDSNLALNQNKDVTLAVPEFAHPAGTWHSEVSKLVYDPRSGEWVLIWFRYLLINNDRQFMHSWFSLKHASLPENLPTATEHKFLAAGAYDVRNDIL
ncbi:MAG: exo-alpha-sialidase, partial [Bdellovibrionales bacterium]|nr:exo-alpha-sialidase [Bdellovibrionales bacterium]